FGFAENTDDLFVGKTLLHGDVLMWLMKTLLTSGCTNQRGAGHELYIGNVRVKRLDLHHKSFKKLPTCISPSLWINNLLSLIHLHNL
ncbi:hypothetical protein DN619_32305, partial [Klebsiella michiganensis]